MKVITIVRTRNEARNIARFCYAYRWVNHILVADGGSTDNTVSIAKCFLNAKVQSFDEKVFSNDGQYWRNPHGKHINFLIKWAEAEGADWIIFDDCDCIPNHTLRCGGHEVLEKCNKDFVLANRVYVYGDDKYFEGLTKPDNNWTGSLWAWRSFNGFRADESDPWKHYFDIRFTNENSISLKPPYCLLHYFYQNDEYAQRKLHFYKNTGELPEARDPKEYGGKLLPLEEWMIQ